VVTIFGPTNPVRWGPWPQGAQPQPAWLQKSPRQTNGRVILLQAEQDCVACGHAGCEDHHDSRSACLEAVSPQRVLAQCLAVLQAQSSDIHRSLDVH
jgi:heptosyltransferase-3